jgi:hypothetical protein
MFDLIKQLSESRLLPTPASYTKYTARELCEMTLLNLCALRILYIEKINQDWSKIYARNTLSIDDTFKKWNSSGNDLYNLLHIIQKLTTDKDEKWRGIVFRQQFIQRWLRDLGNESERRYDTDRLFGRIDQDFQISDSSVRSIRRLVIEWEDIDLYKKKLALTRMLQIFRARMSSSEMLPKLEKLADKKNLEILDAENKEDDEDLKENATAGGTGSGAVAVVVGGIGAGFDADYSKSIYPAPVKKPKVAVLRR